MIHQLRTYELFEHNKSAFHARFRDHAARIMQRYDFKLVAIWDTSLNGRTEFAYLLAWPDVATMERAWNAFRDDPEWQEAKRSTTEQHGALVGAIEDRVLTPTDYAAALIHKA